MDDLLLKLLAPFHYFFEIQQRIYWGYLLTSLTAATLIYFFNRRSRQKKSTIGLFRYLFPRQVYCHPSALNDYLFFFTNALLATAFFTPISTYISINTTLIANQLLSEADFLLPWKNCLNHSSAYTAVSLTIFIALASDFAIFYAHYLQHRVPWLWEFHKVHHSAEVMTPITVYRMHPVDILLAIIFNSLLSGSIMSLYQFTFKPEINIYNIAGINLIFILFYLSAYNLRHSHIWFSYGPYLNRIFISPAQHQIHHSMDSKHLNKNMGFIFAFWDSMFKTLYVPKQPETLKFGINQKENIQFSSFWALYLTPFINLTKKLNLTNKSKLNQTASLAIFLLITGSALFFLREAPINQQPFKAVFMEDMTWQEIKQAIADDKTTVLVPTGGTEQNGPHLILGKHNHIIEYTSSKIAKALKNTLIAPTITYVPEGNIEPPEGHMKFTGTLSISNQIFGQLLEASARSLKAHGFKVIAFIGDSGDNQATQRDVAAKLDQQWQSEGIRVLHTGDYYQKNGQAQYLLNKGYTPQQIGGHAGIRDTSELMAVYPTGVRMALLSDNSTTDFSQSGANGDATKANASIGEILLDLKIAAALSQIKMQLN